MMATLTPIAFDDEKPTITTPALPPTDPVPVHHRLYLVINRMRLMTDGALPTALRMNPVTVITLPFDYWYAFPIVPEKNVFDSLLFDQLAAQSRIFIPVVSDLEIKENTLMCVIAGQLYRYNLGVF